MATTHFKIGDRVHFKETPTKLGVIKEINSRGKLGVRWDEGDPNESENGEAISYYPRHHLIVKNERKRPRGNPKFLSKETNPAVIASASHPVFPNLPCTIGVTIQIPEKVKRLISGENGKGINEELCRKIQFLIRKDALKASGHKSWEELVED